MPIPTPWTCRQRWRDRVDTESYELLKLLQVQRVFSHAAQTGDGSWGPRPLGRWSCTMGCPDASFVYATTNSVNRAYCCLRSRQSSCCTQAQIETLALPVINGTQIRTFSDFSLGGNICRRCVEYVFLLCLHAFLYTRRCPCLHTCPHTCLRTCLHTCLQTCPHTYTHTYTYGYTHVCTHGYTHVGTQAGQVHNGLWLSTGMSTHTSKHMSTRKAKHVCAGMACRRTSQASFLFGPLSSSPHAVRLRSPSCQACNILGPVTLGLA